MSRSRRPKPPRHPAGGPAPGPAEASRRTDGRTPTEASGGPPRAASGRGPRDLGEDAAAQGPWAIALAIVLVGVLVYANALDGPFVFDDRLSIVDNTTIESLSDLGTVLSPPHETPVAGRPLVNLTLAVNYAIGGRDVTGYHVVNLALHVLCALLVFGVTRRALRSPAVRASTGPAADGLAAAVALVWVVHPINSEVVNYLTQRTESLMAACYLTTLYAAIRAWSSPRRAAWVAAAVVACAAGMLCKESMVTAPVVVMLFDRAFFATSFRDAGARRSRLYGGLAATWIVLAMVVASSPRGLSAGFGAHDAAPWNYLLNQSRLIVEYLELAFWPRSLVLYYGWPVPLTLSDIWPFAMVVLALVGASVVAWRRSPPLGFLGAWFFITLAPTSSLVPIATEVGAERRMYLPVVAIVALVVVAAWWLIAGRRRATAQGALLRPEVAATARDTLLRPEVAASAVALVVVVTSLGLVTRARNVEYQSSLTLAETTAARWPSPGGRSMYGTELAAAGRLDEAEAQLRLAAPGFPPARYFLGTVLADRGNLGEAASELQRYVDSEPDTLTQVHRARGVLADALLRLGRTGDAVRVYRQMIAAQPSDWDALAALANTLVRNGQFDEAVARYQAYLAQAPNNGRALGGLAVALAAQGRMEEAIIAFRRAVDADPGNPRSQQNLARALAGAGRFAEAEAPASRAVALAPDDAGAQFLLGQVLAALGQTARAREAFERARVLDPSGPAADALKKIGGGGR